MKLLEPHLWAERRLINTRRENTSLLNQMATGRKVSLCICLLLMVKFQDDKARAEPTKQQGK